jgi:hypothetical protein
MLHKIKIARAPTGRHGPAHAGVDDRVGAQQRFQIARRERPADQVPLALVAALKLEERLLAPRLDALGDHAKLEALPEAR